MNKLKVNKLIEDIEAYISELEGYLPITEVELKTNKQKQYAISFIIEQIANESINLGNHLISSFGLRLPSTSKEVFDILEEGDFITSNTVKNMKKLVEVRNIIAHRYVVLALDELVGLVNNMDFVRDFIREIIDKVNE